MTEEQDIMVIDPNIEVVDLFLKDICDTIEMSVDKLTLLEIENLNRAIPKKIKSFDKLSKILSTTVQSRVGFNCSQCGRCCNSGIFYATSDIAAYEWDKIVDYYRSTYHTNRVRFYDMWECVWKSVRIYKDRMVPEEFDYVERCPFLRQCHDKSGRFTAKFECGIQPVKPMICSNFPFSREQIDYFKMRGECGKPFPCVNIPITPEKVFECESDAEYMGYVMKMYSRLKFEARKANPAISNDAFTNFMRVFRPSSLREIEAEAATQNLKTIEVVNTILTERVKSENDMS